MTLDQYRNFVKEERDIIHSTLEKMKYPTPNGIIPISLWDIETYYKKRHQERKKSPHIPWPVNLSKKEQVICKIDMIRSMLEYSLKVATSNAVPTQNTDEFTFITAMILFCKSIEKDIYSHKSTIDGPRWAGITSDTAKLLNLLFKSMMKSFQKKP
jgi:hypothetical protein